MDAFSGYVYTALWFVVAIYMAYLAIKHSKFFFVLSGFFLFMSVWYLINELTPDIDMFAGTYQWIFRAVAMCILIVIIIAYIIYKKSVKNEDSSEKTDF